MAHEGAGIVDRQFAAPRGLAGWVTGLVMARLNVEANRWMVDLLDVGPRDSVLDVGCGPGLAVAAAADRATQGFVAGIDRSGVMIRQAAGRNRAAVRAGRVEVRVAEAARLPYPDGRFTKAGSLNSLQFWPDLGAGLRELRRVLAPGGHLAVVLVARSEDPGGGQRPTYRSAPPWLHEIAQAMTAGGFAGVQERQRMCGPLLHWALLARRDERRGRRPDALAP